MRPIVGLIPAAGRATRLALDRGSKEVLPVTGPDGSSRPVIANLLEAMSRAGVERAFVVLRRGKWDVPEVLVDLAEPGWPELAWIVTPGTGSIPETVGVAGPWLQDSEVVLGFPDVSFTPRNAMTGLLAARALANDDITLALFPSDRPDKTDMVEIADGSVTGFRVKPGPSELTHTWILAGWGPRFTRFLSAHLETLHAIGPKATELQLSQVFAAALADGLSIGGHFVAGGTFIDIGTPEDLERAGGSRSGSIEGDS
jgi:glucose-1-phosphate thymidylyltransferase